MEPEPRQPPEKALYHWPAGELGHRRLTSDRRHLALVVVPEWARVEPVSAAQYLLGGVLAGLDGDLGQLRARVP